MSLSLQSPVSAGVVEAFCLAGLVDIGSTIVCGGLPGVARRQVTFLASPRKVTKRRRPEVGIRCIEFPLAEHNCPQGQLRNPRLPFALRGSLRSSQTRAAAELGLELLPRNRLRLCSPSDSPRGLPLSRLVREARPTGRETPPKPQRLSSGPVRSATTATSHCHPGAGRDPI